MNLYEKLKKHFDETPKEQVLKDWEETKIYDNVNSPTVEQLVSKENKILNKQQNGNDLTANIRSSFSDNHKYRIHLDNMKFEICELVKDCFNPVSDPEMQWKFFREQLIHYKREQILKWLKTDDD